MKTSIFVATLKLEGTAYRETYYIAAQTAEKAMKKAYKAFAVDTRDFFENEMVLLSLVRQDARFIR